MQMQTDLPCSQFILFEQKTRRAEYYVQGLLQLDSKIGVLKKSTSSRTQAPMNHMKRRQAPRMRAAVPVQTPLEVKYVSQI